MTMQKPQGRDAHCIESGIEDEAAMVTAEARRIEDAVPASEEDETPPPELQDVQDAAEALRDAVTDFRAGLDDKSALYGQTGHIADAAAKIVKEVRALATPRTEPPEKGPKTAK